MSVNNSEINKTYILSYHRMPTKVEIRKWTCMGAHARAPQVVVVRAEESEVSVKMDKIKRW